AFAEIPAWHPAVDTVIPVALRRWRRRPLQHFGGPEWRQFTTALHRRHYNAVIDAQGLLKSAFVARLVRAPRYGLDRESVREKLATLVYHHRINVPRDMHAVERTRMLFSRVMKYPLPEEPVDYGVRAKLKTGADKLPASLLFFHGTARSEKLWPEENWMTLADLAVTHGYNIWLPWGDQRERDRAERIAAGRDRVQVLPRLDLRGLATMLMEVNGAVAVDTGLGHLSAALDVPTVSLYGPTSTELIGAYGGNQCCIQSPIGPSDSSDAQAMMRSITADSVWLKLTNLLRESS
ncbi:MAG: lipopolysaccharide heptosyltransferase I, partial [Halieaceae bacterium]|nr:lipopolysaccharide heptosyltransferase I [Halieaceae bacterium]